MAQLPYSIADRSAQRRAAQTVFGLAGSWWDNKNRADASLSLGKHKALVNVEIEKVKQFAIDNPGAPIAKYRESVKKMEENILADSQNVNTGLAKQAINLYDAQNLPFAVARAETEIEVVESKRMLNDYFGQIEVAISNGDYGEINRSNDGMKDFFPPEELERLRNKQLNQARYQSEVNRAMVDPEGILKDITTKDGNAFLQGVEGSPELSASQVQKIGSIAEGRINYNKRRDDAALSAFYSDISKKAQEGISYDEMRELIINQPGLSTEEKEKAMTVYNSAFNTWGRGGTKENPWKTTQDYNALMGMQIKISRGEPVTEMDIWRAQAAQPEKGPLFSRSDGLNLINQLPDNKDPIMKTTFAEEWTIIAYNVYATEKVDNKNVIPEDDLPAYQETQNAIEAIIKKNGLDFTKSQKEIKEVLEPVRKERANKTLSKIWGFLTASPLTTAIRIGRVQSELSEARKQSGK